MRSPDEIRFTRIQIRVDFDLDPGLASLWDDSKVTEIIELMHGKSTRQPRWME